MNEHHDVQVNSEHPSSESWIWVALAWTAVSVPLGWGIWQTLKQAAVLFF